MEINESIKGLTEWQLRACEIAENIKFKDLHDVPVYFIRDYGPMMVYADLTWHPDHLEGELEYPDKLGVTHLSYRYKDDRTIQLLIKSKILILEKTVAFEVNNEMAESLGILVGETPGGYMSYPNWEGIINKTTTLQQNLSGKVQASVSDILVKDFEIRIIDQTPNLIYKNNVIYQFRSLRNKSFHYFKYCLEKINEYIKLQDLFENYKKICEVDEIYPKKVAVFNRNINRLLKITIGKINLSIDKTTCEFVLDFRNSCAKLTIINKS